MRPQVKWQGREALYRRLNELLPNVEKEVAIEQLEGAKELANRIRPRAPRDTGEYAASLVGDKLSNHKGERAIGQPGKTKDPNATGIFGEFIWRFLEFGTVKMTARPHIFPTYRAYRKTLRRRIAGAVNKAVRKAKKG
ncbi:MULTISPECIES: HK97-gp10 family putative phage morphogenesis protein [unclassified Mesorhizobium]|uniref:HK97-gp10 family putative phage morphogenesis protein n=1 Tax=unclassified Mesorhizobium TaxID=325217 RepID=UPI00112EB0F2|nr:MULTISPECIES: HK97-gp10 family putative phage morphogenesis protein [unclassified Mesorhizobium]MCA0025473.1 HK97 gp10 family phage protein [Mesorhizobium sp. B263B1A]TPJ97138.1 HK97 gp10 family phage protein [Mesorhizobium sp. B2-5-12]TPK27195.1 HK97 gp10 family phage protein [Mesorhizobium sp. B2-5-6]